MDIGKGTLICKSSLDGLFPELIHIGENCIISPRVMLLTHDASSFIFTGEYRVAPVVIGDRCFVGYGAIILPGVTIGDDVIIGAGSVVTKNIPSGVVVAGNPARIIESLVEFDGKQKNMVRAPYAGKSPNLINQDDINEFRKILSTGPVVPIK